MHSSLNITITALRDKKGRNFPEMTRFIRHLGIFTCHKSATWDRRLSFLSAGRHTEDFSPEKSEGFGRA
jgi:hypothetical protein